MLKKLSVLEHRVRPITDTYKTAKILSVTSRAVDISVIRTVVYVCMFLYCMLFCIFYCTAYYAIWSYDHKVE